ncbi:hypothetical protein BsWGS_28487 [Bradybaena similaris]
MRRRCTTQRVMSSTLMSISLLAITVLIPSCSFPLRHVGGQKKVIKHNTESRDLVLCWLVQIRTREMNCDCHVKGDNLATHAREELRNGTSDGRMLQQQPTCSCQYQHLEHHMSDFSSEVGLHLVHTFEHFPDHCLLCLVTVLDVEAAPYRNTFIQAEASSRSCRLTEDLSRRHPASRKYKSETMSQIHRLHSDVKSMDKLLFDRHKEDVENRLQQHDEVLWFSPEYVHHRHSRSLAPELSYSEKLQHPDWGDNLSWMNYSARQSQPQKQLTQSSDANLHGSKSRPLSISSIPKRSLDIRFNDPEFPNQWHLVNHLTIGMDLNVTGVWSHNYTGQGVTVAVVDDGLQWSNPDLQDNYNHGGSWDMNDNDPDPSPSASKLSNHHGTRCAGEIAAIANNHICGVGVAFRAQVSGLRVLDGLMTDSMEAEAFNMKMDVNDVYSCSWGPDDDGRTVDGPHLMAAKALQRGVDFGRRGYGSIYVLASGNGGDNQDNCNFDGYANSIYTVTVGAVDDKGSMPYYAEECASMLGVTFSSGSTNKRDIVTTDWTVAGTGGCTERHTGTSAAAPLAAAMIALMLQARPCLSWRDVQYIIILTAKMVDVHFAHSQRNGAGLSHSHKHGFGLLDSWRLVNAARVWPPVPWLTSYSYNKANLDLVIPKGKDVSLTVVHVVSEAEIRGLGLFTLENVQLTLTLSHPCRGKIGVTLTSPSGTVSVLAAPRPKDNSTEGFRDWTFTSVRCWGEPPTGNWTFSVTDHDSTSFGPGQVTKWRLTLFGTSLTSQEFADRQKLVNSAMSGEFLHTSHSPCPQSPRFNPVSLPVSDRILKVLILCGAFCFIMAIYETFEYMFCYNDEKQEAARSRRLLDRAQELTNTATAVDTNGHQLLHMSNGTSSLGAEANHTQNLTDDEEDIFDMSETRRLLTGDRSYPSCSGVRELGEDIPLATFSLMPAGHGYLPLSQSTMGENATDATLNIPPDHITDSPATPVTSDSVSR